MTATFAENLPTKFLQHYLVYRWENYGKGESPVGNHEKEITLKSADGKDTVVVTRNETQRNDTYIERTITLNGKKVLDDVKYLIPWTDAETNTEKLQL
jgi:endo-alpha-N-acetylgalactosaminidase